MTLADADNILTATAAIYGVRPMALIGRRCHGVEAIAKRHAMHAMRAKGAPLTLIARVLGMRGHQPVLYGLRRFAGCGYADARRAA